MEILLLMVGPAIVAIVALAVALRLLRAPQKGQQTAPRLVGSYLLALVAFGIGTCYASLSRGLYASGRGEAALFVVPLLVLLGGITVFYLVRVKKLPDPDTKLREAFGVPVDGQRPPRGMAILILCVIAALAALLLAGLLL